MPKPQTLHIQGNTYTFHLEDCVEGMARHLSDQSVDVIVTSPPYNLGVKYSKYDDSMPREEYLEWTHSWLKQARRVLSDAGSLFLNIAGVPSDPWGPFEVLFAARGILELQNVIHWIKSIHIPEDSVGRYGILRGDLTVGHYKPISSPRFLNDCHEYVFHLTKSGHVPVDRLALGVPYQDKVNIARWKNAGVGLHCRGNTWFVPYKTIKSRDKERPHPASYPAELADMCIRLHGVQRCALVLDPFLGIGNTAIAGVWNKVDCVGFEIDAGYLAEARRRVREQGQRTP